MKKHWKKIIFGSLGGLLATYLLANFLFLYWLPEDSRKAVLFFARANFSSKENALKHKIDVSKKYKLPFSEDAIYLPNHCINTNCVKVMKELGIKSDVAGEDLLSPADIACINGKEDLLAEWYRGEVFPNWVKTFLICEKNRFSPGMYDVFSKATYFERKIFNSQNRAMLKACKTVYLNYLSDGSVPKYFLDENKEEPGLVQCLTYIHDVKLTNKVSKYLDINKVYEGLHAQFISWIHWNPVLLEGVNLDFEIFGMKPLEWNLRWRSVFPYHIWSEMQSNIFDHITKNNLVLGDYYDRESVGEKNHEWLEELYGLRKAAVLALERLKADKDYEGAEK